MLLLLIFKTVASLFWVDVNVHYGDVLKLYRLIKNIVIFLVLTFTIFALLQAKFFFY